MADLSADPTMHGPYIFIQRVGPVPTAFILPVRPQHVQIDEPARIAIHQTVSGNYVDDFSGPTSVLAKVELRGTFGFDKKFGGIGIIAPGSVHLLAFEKLYETFNALSRSLKARLGAVQEFVCIPRLYFWRIVIEHFRIQADARDPVLWHWSTRFTRVQDYLSPTAPSLPPALGLPSGASLGGLFG